MIRAAIREITPRGVRVTISIPGGSDLAQRTFNPRLGIVGGLSILGTTGIVRPFSCPALREALRCGLSVAAAEGITAPVLVPGHLGERAARTHFRLTAGQVVEVGNEWGYVLDRTAEYPFRRLLVVGHPGKLAKLIAGDWDTHSARSRSAVATVATLGGQARGKPLPPSPTVEGLFQGLAEAERRQLAELVAQRVREAVVRRIEGRCEVAVGLVDMHNAMLGCSGDLSPWH
jgi:cobalt-precorrin-5B (C1)-methyltransferase